MNNHLLEAGKRIKVIRESYGYSQEEFAEKLCISRNHLAKIEVGLRSVTAELLLTVALFTGASLDYIVLGRTSPNQELKTEVHSLIQSLIVFERVL